MGLFHEDVAQKLAELATESKTNFEISELIKNPHKVGQ